MSPGNVVIPPPPPLSDFQRRALTLYIKKKRTHYERKDAVISRKYRWLEDLNQRDPDLEGIEISESSLEELKKKRESLCDEKHRLFDQLKNLLPATEEEEQPASQFPGQPGLYPGNPQTVYPGNPQGAYLTPQPGYQPPYHISSGYPTGSNFHPTNYGPPFSSTPYSVITEPVTPKKPSEMSPVQIMKPSDMSPLSSHERTGYNRSWDNVSPVSKTADSESVEFNRYPSTEYTTPSAATKYAETRENRIDSFTKAFTDTISKAMMSEMNMSKESASKSDPKPNPRSSPLKPPEPTPTTPSKTEPLLSPKHKPKETPEPKKTEPAVRPRSPDITRKSEIKPAEVSKRSEGKQTEARRVEHTSGNKSRKSISGTESNSSVSSLKHPSQSPQLKQRKEEVSDLPPVIKISKAEIHSKVMSWPTSHPFPRKAADRTPDSEKKPAGKKESADSSGSSLLEFAFQSALFGNTLFGDKEASPTPPQVMKKWRDDGKCGMKHRLLDGTPAQCDPDGDFPCCDDARGDGTCGNEHFQCYCPQCEDYKLLRDWEESGGTLMWRHDGLCGKGNYLPDDTLAECDPDGEKPCCFNLEHDFGGECSMLWCQYLALCMPGMCRLQIGKKSKASSAGWKLCSSQT